MRRSEIYCNAFFSYFLAVRFTFSGTWEVTAELLLIRFRIRVELG